MSTTLVRDVDHPSCDCLIQGTVVSKSLESIYEELHIDGIIRIHTKDYSQFPPGPLFTHFNLENSGHQKDKIYAFPKIVIPGYYISPQERQSPVLDFSQCYLARCSEVRERVPYDKLTQKDFQYSFHHIQNTDQLKKEILWRYTRSLPATAPDDILQRGVSITTLEIIQRQD